jgi:hypothetical protein
MDRRRTWDSAHIRECVTSGASRQMLAESRMTASEQGCRKSGRPVTDPTQSPGVQFAFLQSGRSSDRWQLRVGVVSRHWVAARKPTFRLAPISAIGQLIG